MSHSSALTAPLTSPHQSSSLDDGSDPYLLLVCELLLPALRTSVLTAWRPRDPEPLLHWLDLWEPLLPSTAMHNILDSLVMPRLRQAVGEWEPRQETVPIHAWLHPWLPYLGPSLEELYPGIRHKLGMALQVQWGGPWRCRCRVGGDTAQARHGAAGMGGEGAMVLQVQGGDTALSRQKKLAPQVQAGGGGMLQAGGGGVQGEEREGQGRGP